VSAVQDKEVVVARNENYWAGAPKIEGVRFTVVPDAITSALELRKGTADLASNVVTFDMIQTLEQAPNLKVESGQSSVVIYTNFNVNDPMLRDRRVRQAIACAMDKQAIVDAIWRGQARRAETLLPEGHWAAASHAEMAQYPHDPARAERLLDDAGFHRGPDGIRLKITLKTSTDETTRLMAAVLQQQLRAAGIRLDIRSAEFGTFYADVTRGAFQMYALRWIGSNEDPDIFRYTYGTNSFPPKGANRGRYSNPRVDTLLTAAAAETDQSKRRVDYVEVQKILAEDLPGIPLWYPNNEVVHSRRIDGVKPIASGTFDYLREITVR
jgi:peptide/nickel transport system substrate-binding protein